MKQRKLDLMKKYGEYYKARTIPEIVEIEEGSFLSIEGKGAPGSDEFQAKVSALYSLTYGVKVMMKKEGKDFTVAKLEGLWCVDSNRPYTEVPREEWRWRLLIRQPEFVTLEVVEKARDEARKKKKAEFLDEVKFERMKEGKCVQILHIGPYSTEPESIAKMQKLMEEKFLVPNGFHHEIYLVGPGRSGKVPSSKFKTILRQPVREK